MSESLINGVVNILKPPGMTSFDVIAHLRKLTKQKRIGHSGTLDPEAIGVLPTYFGNACGAIEFEQENTKGYIAEIVFGISTDSEDITGNIVDIRQSTLNQSSLEIAIEALKGEHFQVPPMYSAVKVNGKKLYELARKGVEVERKARKISIFDAKLLKTGSRELQINDNKLIFNTAMISIVCSRGTYIRTVCKDLANSLNTIGTMAFLLRNSSGSFNLNRSITLEEIEELSKAQRFKDSVIPTKELFSGFRAFVLDNSNEKKYMNGVAIHYNGIELDEKTEEEFEFISVYNSSGDFISLGKLEKNDEGMFLKSRKFFL